MPGERARAVHGSEYPAGFAPFGIQNIDGDLFVTYAVE
jgi:hypothetical protein